MKTMTFEVGGDGVAMISIDVPGRPMNVITPEFTADLTEAVEAVAGDETIRGAIITSAKPGSFIAGADLKDLVTAFDKGMTEAEAAEFAGELSRLFRRLETCGKPFVAAMNGLALGGGLELCLACHHRVLSNHPKAIVGLPEVSVGLLPGAGGTQRLPRLIGIPKALPLLLQGKQIKPDAALAAGIVDAVGAPESLVDMARAWLMDAPTAEQPWDKKGFQVPGGAGPLAPHALETFSAGNALVSGMTQGNYPAPPAIMSCVYEGTQVSIDKGLGIEVKYFGKLLAGSVARNMIRTLFINKGAADKLAGRPKDVPKSRVAKLGVLGAGMMGAGIAHVSAKAGMEVVLLDSTLDQAEKGKQGIAKLQEKALAKGKTTRDKVVELLERITATDDYALLEGCDLVIEAVFEDRGIKADVTARAEAVIPESATFGSNTSTLPITGLATASKRPKQFIGIHFFSPVEKMPLVEVILGEQTDDATLARTLDYIGQIRKTPIVVHDFPGFYTSRVFGSFTQEGQRMLMDGIEPALIENAAKMAGFPVGPLAVSDEVTLSLQQSIYKQQDVDGLDDKYRGTLARPVVDKMVDELKRPGRRQGGGFYDYPENGQKRLWPGLREAFPPAAEQPDVEELKLRFLYRMAVETARCVEEGVITSPIDADIGSILGIGYPAWTGGTLSFIDTVGVREFVATCKRLAERWGPRFEPPQELQARVEREEGYYQAMKAA